MSGVFGVCIVLVVVSLLIHCSPTVSTFESNQHSNSSVSSTHQEVKCGDQRKQASKSVKRRVAIEHDVSAVGGVVSSVIFD